MKVFATSLAGKVQNIHGRVIINNNGAIETVVLGQFIPAGAVLQCDANATLTLTTDDHRHIFFDGQESHITPTVIDGRNTDVAAIQSLITSGDDPTKHAKASAAGNPTHAGGFGYVTLQRNGDEVLAKTDFSTSGQHRDERLNTELFDSAVHQTGLVIKGEIYTVPEDNKVVLNLLDNDTSVSGDPLSIHSINGTPLTGSDQTIVIEHGHITITADGTITFIPEPNFNGDVNVDYTVTDGTSEEHGHSTVIVTPVNDAPVANPDSFTTNEDTSITVNLTKNDSDVDGDKLTVKEINGMSLTGGEQTVVVDNGKIVIAHDGGMTFVPSDNYHGDVTVPYTITDGDKSATSTVTIHVTPVNDAPIANPDSFTTDEDTPITVDLTKNDRDVDGDTVTIKEINGTSLTGGEQTVVVDNGKIVIAHDGSMTFVPRDNYHGDVTVPYTITDGDKTATSTATIHVTPVNDAPVANPDSFTTDEDTSITVNLTNNDSDVDGDKLTVKEINGIPLTGGEQTIVVDHGKIVIADDGGMTFIPSDNYHGDVTVPYTITDGDKSATSTVTIHVTPINDAPVANPDSFTTDEDTSITVDLIKNDHDIDGDKLTVKEINGTPLTGGEQTVVVDNGKIVIAHDGGMTFVPRDNYHGDVTVPYTITDGDKSASSTATIHVTPVNDAPVATPDSFTTGEDTPITVDLIKNDHDIDGDKLTVKEINGTSVIPGHEQTIVVDNGKIVIAHDGGMIFIPSDNYHGDVTVPYTITDGDKSASSTATIHVTPVNDAPVANPDSFTTDEDTSITVDLTENDHDVDGDKLTVKEINGTPVTPGHEQTIVVDNGKIVIADDGGMTFIPSDNYHGDVTVPYTITDGDKTATSTVTIHVTPVNDAPIANPDSFTTDEDISITVDLTKNDHDVDSDKLTVKEINGTSLTGGEQTVVVDNGKIVIADDGGMTFIPSDNYHGDVTVPYTITDGDKSATSTVTMHVTPINDAPIANPDSFTTDEDTSITVDLIKNDSDIDGDKLTVTEINGTPLTGGEQTVVVENGKIVIAHNGGMTFVPNKDYNGTVDVNYTITDDDKSASSTAKIVVSPEPDKAEISGEDHGLVTEDVSDPLLSTTGTLVLSDADTGENAFKVENQLSGSAKDGKALGHLSIDEHGEWTYQVNNSDVQYLKAGETRVETFHVHSADGTAHEVVITIVGTNDAPEIKYPDMEGTWISADYTEGTGGQSLTTQITLSDIDSEKLSIARITITPQVGENSYDPLHDSFVLSKAFQSKYELISDNYIDENHQEVGVWLLKTKDNSFVPVQEFENVLKHLEYKNTAEHMVGINQSKSIGIDVYDDHNAVSNRLSIAVKMHEVNNAPKIDLHNNGSVNVSEEGLANGNPDNIGNPEDTTNKTVAEGSFKVTDVDSTNVSVRLEGPEGITSNGKLIYFTWDQSSQELIGFIGDTDNKAMMIKLSESNGEYKYTANLFAPVDHLDGHSENIKDIIINVIADDHNSYNGKSISHININIEDDKPLITEIIYDKPTFIPEIISTDYHFNRGNYRFSGDEFNTYDFRGNYNSIGKDQGFDGITVTAKGFHYSEHGWSDELTDAYVNASYTGIGVNSSYEPYFPLPNEVDGRFTPDGRFLSEELVIKLDPGSVAYGVKITFDKMFGGELETGVVHFYRNGHEIVEPKIFTSKSDSGDFAGNFEVHDGGFDTMVINALDNHVNNDRDNTDFTVTSIDFLGKESHDGAKYYQSGSIIYKGADSAELTFNDINAKDLRSLDDGQRLTVVSSDNQVVATDSHDNVVFEFHITPVTGKWEYYQYKSFTVDNSDKNIDFLFTTSDKDGDFSEETLKIKPVNIENYDNQLLSSETEHHLLFTLEDNSFAINSDYSGSNEIVNFNVNKDHLDISDLLHSVKDNELDKFLTLRQDGKNTDIAINNDGKGDIEQHIILDNVNSNDVVKNIGVITNNLLHSDGDKLILNTHQDLHAVMPEHHPLIPIHHEEQIS
ncbi:retention module-containing protein [Photobacterium leiognathi]|uniref:retention module-containing protein n=1 Tax=Photobacterium leiognathi TaxID=553611 RepID=UPI0029815235|nr:retention module-containing protein [Photobacterium leiognathi]